MSGYAFALSAIAVLAATSCHCGGPGLEVSTAELRIEPPALDFGEVPLFARQTLMIELRNEGLGRFEALLEVAPPYAVSEKELTLGGGETKNLAVSFIPREAGPAHAVLTVFSRDRSEPDEHVIALSGTGATPPRCESPWPCWDARVDGLQCRAEPKPDGAACVATCLDDARCFSGVCRGTARTCPDDGDACTVEVCGVRGCLSTPRVCAPPAGPCQVSQCDRALGCVTNAVPDGTACGAPSCGTALVCIAGQCVTRAVPEGVVCGEESPCQARGRCDGNACVRPPITPLVAREERVIVSDEQGATLRSVVFSADGGYRVDGSRFEVVNADGGVRWSADLPHNAWVFGFGVVDESRVTLVGREHVEVRNWNSGALLWQAGFCELGGQAGRTGCFAHDVGTDDRGSLLFAIVSAEPSTTLVSVDASTGALRWRTRTTHVNTGGDLVGALGGGLWYLDHGRLFRASTQGQVREASATIGAQWLDAVAGGRVWTVGSGGRDLLEVALDGGVVRSQRAATSLFGGSVTHTRGDTRVVTRDGGRLQLSDQLFLSTEGHQVTTVTVAYSHGGLVATDARGASWIWSDPGLLSYVTPEGRHVWSCPVTGPPRWPGGEYRFQVGFDSLVTSIAVIPMPGVRPAPAAEGWSQINANHQGWNREVR